MEVGDTWEANARVLRTLTHQQNTPICSKEVAARSAHLASSEKVHKIMQAAVVALTKYRSELPGRMERVTAMDRLLPITTCCVYTWRGRKCTGH
jgi:hypothetical protein